MCKRRGGPRWTLYRKRSSSEGHNGHLNRQNEVFVVPVTLIPKGSQGSSL